MKTIYTKTGDEGMTSLRGGVRVPKDDLRIEVNGQLDMLNALLGMLPDHHQLSIVNCQLLHSVQQELMVVMSHVATPDGEENPRTLHCDELTARMEEAIDQMKGERPAGFVLPRGIVHVARAQCRTAERRLWTLHREHPLDLSILRMLNRLSDFLFVLSIQVENSK
ncbi:MAG: ATP:cob(I)alamin adenosyltransferase [Prevotella sp.]|nr:ATP:cob(I)alamin adenosyltransferase [Prevotella sp.]